MIELLSRRIEILQERIQDQDRHSVHQLVEIERLRKELQSFREANMLLNSMIETEHKIIKTKGE